MQLKMMKQKIKSFTSFWAKIFVFYLIFILKSHVSGLESNNNLISIGPDAAPVKIKVFSSLTCPHCANFHIKVVPEIMKKYVNSGKVQIIFIDFPLDQVSFNASKLLHCLDKKKQLSFLDNIYENQNKWTSGSNLDEINNNLKNIVKKLGIDSEKFDKCLNNENIADRILAGRIVGQEKYSINSTPTIVINEKKLEGSVDFKNIRKKIEKLI